jgi:hypothetical protein
VTVLAIGQILSIGFYPAWKLYKYYWLSAPVAGPVLVLAGTLPVITGEALWNFVKRRFGPKVAGWTLGPVLVLLLASGGVVGGFLGAREDNPNLNSQPVSSDALSKTLGEQNRTLNAMSQSGKSLLDQLNATEIELENAKKELTATLTNFDLQREAAEQVSHELKAIDARQKQLALQTEELQRILQGQEPITRHDLQRANWVGLGTGVVIGFLTSLLASVVFNALTKKTKAAV